jgi:hypothetical protein
MLNRLTDTELIEAYLANEARGREYTTERLAAKENR